MASEVPTKLAIDAALPACAAEPATERSERVLLLVALSAAAGMIHARALIDHAPHYWLFGLFFGVLTYAQVLWAIALHRRPNDTRWLRPAAWGSLAVVAVWVVTRTVGLPIGPWAGRPEQLGVPDITASLDELVLAAVLFAMLRPAGRMAARLRWLNAAHCMRIGSMLVSLSLLTALLGNHAHPGTS